MRVISIFRLTIFLQRSLISQKKSVFICEISAILLFFSQISQIFTDECSVISVTKSEIYLQ